MAGDLAIVASEQPERPMDSITWQCQVHFARFFNFPTTASTCPALRPIADGRRSLHRGGSWIAADSPTASVRILSDLSVSGAILVVVFHGKVLEEHYISKLQFTWPQVSCLSGFPPRGCRAVFVSYKDAFDEIQKFALRFPTTNDAESFIYILKENLKNAGEFERLDNGHRSDISAGSKQMVPHSGRPTRSRKKNIIVCRTCEESAISATSDSCSMETPTSLDTDFEQHSCVQETTLNRNYKSVFPALPPGFALQPTNCCPNPEQGSQLTAIRGVLSPRSKKESTSEELSISTASCNTPEIITDLGPKVEQHSNTLGMKPNKNPEGVFPSLPPSFTSLMNSCCSSAEQAGSQPTATCTVFPSISKRKRTCEELSITTTGGYTPEMATRLNSGVQNHFYSQQTTLNKKSEGIIPALPSSFTSLLTYGCSNPEQATNQPTASEDIDLKSQIARYMEDASFQEMIFKVERIIDELGGDMKLQ